MTTTETLPEHFARYLVSLGFWPSADEQRRWATSTALGAHAESGWASWSAERRQLATEQLTFRWTGIDTGPIDGLDGPQTRAARAAYAHWQQHGRLPEWRDDDPTWTDHPRLPVVTRYPPESEAASYYGTPGDEVRSQLVHVDCPWPLRLAWAPETVTNRILIHHRCADGLRDVLAAVHAHYGTAELIRLRLDQYGGSYAHRRKRGGTAWSVHAYGAAIDWDPLRNGLTTKAPEALLSGALYADWWRIWEAAGWLSLGRARNFDWMHVQAAML